MRLPEIVDFNVTGRCNLDCSYCYGPSRDTTELSLEQIARAFDVLFAGGTRALVVTGGEPLVRKDIVEVLRLAKRAGFRLALQTNGLLLPQRSGVLELVDWLCMPLDGSCRAIVEEVRGSPDGFDCVLRVLEGLPRSGSSTPRIKIGTVVVRANLQDLPNIARLLSSYRVDVWKCHEVRPRGKAAKGYDSLHVPATAIRAVVGTIKAECPSLNLYFSDRGKSVRAYLFIYPDGEIRVPLLDRYDVVGNILSLPGDFDYTRFLDADQYRANARAAFLDTFLKGGSEELRVAICAPSVPESMALCTVLSMLTGGALDAGRNVAFAADSDSRAHLTDVAVVSCPGGVGTRRSLSGLKQLLRSAGDAVVLAYGIACGSIDVLEEAPEALLLQLRGRGRSHTGPLLITTILDDLRNLPFGGGPSVRPIYPRIPHWLLLDDNHLVSQFVVLSGGMERSAFRLNDEDWTSIQSSIVRRLGSSSYEAEARLAEQLGARVMHDLKVSERSIINYALCMFGYEDSQLSAVDGVRAVSAALGADVPVDSFLEQVEFIKERRAARGEIGEMPLHEFTTGARILLVDDHPEQWAALFGLVLGCTIETAASMEEVESRWGSVADYDAVLLDLYLSDAPEPDGLAILRRLDSLGSPPPVVVFTTSENYQWARSAGRHDACVGFVNKNMENLSDCSAYLDFRRAIKDAIADRSTRRVLRHDDIVRDIEALAARCHSFSLSPISPESIEEYVTQFRTPRNIRMVMKLLRHVQFFSRESVAATMFELMRGTSWDYDRCVLVSFGGVFDSSKLLSYLHGDFVQHQYFKGLSLANSLGEALQVVRDSAGRKDTILFFDDLLGMGSQAIQVYSEWLSIACDGRVDKQHVQPLTDQADRDLLKRVQIRHLYLIAFAEGIARLGTFWRTHGLANTSIEAARITGERDSCFSSAACVFENYKEAEEAKALFSSVGEALLSDRMDLTPDRRRNRALGYGNSGKLFVFFYNVPTCTVTALWKAGMYGGRVWKPLFARRPKE